MSRHRARPSCNRKRQRGPDIPPPTPVAQRKPAPPRHASDSRQPTASHRASQFWHPSARKRCGLRTRAGVDGFLRRAAARAPEAQVARARVLGVLRPRDGAVPEAVRLVAHVAAALLGALTARRRTLRVGHRARRVLDRPVVVHPLPHVADHVVQPVLVLRPKGVDGRRRLVPVVGRVLRGEGALPDVGTVHAIGHQLRAPR
eukprot:702647-Prymnesium_polylepis.1